MDIIKFSLEFITQKWLSVDKMLLYIHGNFQLDMMDIMEPSTFCQSLKKNLVIVHSSW